MMTGNLKGGGRGGGEGPCGACKFLRRKCVRGCIFAPYFDAEQGTTRFAAVHNVFGASNTSKMLLRLPLNKRLDAVVTLCYEALARLRDPVYGTVGHLFSLQHQVTNLQAELAHVRACLSTFQRFSVLPPQQMQQPPFDMAHNKEYTMEPSNLDAVWEEEQLHQAGNEDGECQELAIQFVSKYLPAVKLPACTLAPRNCGRRVRRPGSRPGICSIPASQKAGIFAARCTGAMTLTMEGWLLLDHYYEK